MAEIKKLGRDEVVRRLKVFRDGLRMSMREFGSLEGITQSGSVVSIHTTKHTINISADLWEQIGRDAERTIVDLQAKAARVH